MPTASSYQDKPWLASFEQGVPEKVNYETTCLPAFLARSAERFPDKVALLFQGYQMNYRELNQMVDRFAAALTDFGIQKGDRVAILLPNLIPCVVGYFAILKIQYVLSHFRRLGIGRISSVPVVIIIGVIIVRIVISCIIRCYGCHKMTYPADDRDPVILSIKADKQGALSAEPPYLIRFYFHLHAEMIVEQQFLFFEDFDIKIPVIIINRCKDT